MELECMEVATPLLKIQSAIIDCTNAYTFPTTKYHNLVSYCYSCHM